MAYALIDNASLTSVQRLLGEIPIKNKSVIDGDIAAFENLIVAILFYNDIICINDYKEKYKKSREQKFDFIRFIDPTNFNQREIKLKASELSKDVRPIIKSGKFADDDFNRFFDLLKLNIICTWDISSSVYYLNMKMLGNQNTEEFQKYNQLSAQIFNELTENELSEDNKNYENILIDRHGNPINSGYKIPNAKWGAGTTGGLTPGLAAFIASLNWISYKTIYYTLYANYFTAETFLHPIRHAYQLNFMNKIGAYNVDFKNEIIKKMNDMAIKKIQTLLSSNRSASINLNLPLFSTWLIEKTGDIKEVINYALKLKNTDDFSEMRDILNTIRNMFEENKFLEATKEIQQIILKLEKCLNNIQKKYSIKLPQGESGNNLITVYNSVASTIGWFKLPEIISKLPWSEFYFKNSFTCIYRQIVNDLSNISKLGKYHDMLTKSVVVNDTLPRHNPKCQNPIFSDIHGPFTSPM